MILDKYSTYNNNQDLDILSDPQVESARSTYTGAGLVEDPTSFSLPSLDKEAQEWFDAYMPLEGFPDSPDNPFGTSAEESPAQDEKVQEAKTTYPTNYHRASVDDLIGGRLDKEHDPPDKFNFQCADSYVHDLGEGKNYKKDQAFREAAWRDANAELDRLDNRTPRSKSEKFERIPSLEDEHNLGIPVREDEYQHILKYEWPERTHELTEDFLERTWGRKWKHRLSRVYPILDLLHWKKCENYALALSTTSAYALDIYKSPARVAQVYKWLEEIGIIFAWDSHYLFDRDTGNKDDGICRRYLIDRERTKLLRHIAEDLQLDAWGKAHVTKTEFVTGTMLKKYAAIAEAKKDDELFKKLIDKVRIGKNYTAFPCDVYTEDEIRAAVLIKYPEIAATMRLAADNNKYLPPWQQVIARINITKSKPPLPKKDEDGNIIPRKTPWVQHYTKIGFRTTSHYASFKKRPKDPSQVDPNEQYKEDLFDVHFDSSWYSSDTTSAIPKVNYMLNTGVFLPDSVDLYEVAYRPDCMSSEEFRLNHYRDLFKGITLFLSFVGTSKLAKAKLLRRDRIFKRYAVAFCAAYGKDKLEKTLQNMLDSLTQACGGKLHGEWGFVAESYVEQYALNQAIKKARRERQALPLQIYDELVVSEKLYDSLEQFESDKRKWFNQAAKDFMAMSGKRSPAMTGDVCLAECQAGHNCDNPGHVQHGQVDDSSKAISESRSKKVSRSHLEDDQYVKDWRKWGIVTSILSTIRCAGPPRVLSG